MRLAGWETRLNDFIEKVSKQPFEYGKFDCCLFAGEAIKTLTGVDIRTEIISDQYQSKEEADEMLQKYGGIEGIANRVANRYGFKPIPVLFAQRGDVVIVNIKEVDNFGVCIGKKVAFSSAAGLIFLNITSKSLKKAWRI
jgi:hypothetical protein